MIAFMRMESRAAAEDVIARLNGKKVRGWDVAEAEERVYVRFADTIEQRELRVRFVPHCSRSGLSDWGFQRTEALSADDPGRLSIAQATLLNYRGQELDTSGPTFRPNIPTNNKPTPPLHPLAAQVHELLPNRGPNLALQNLSLHPMHANLPTMQDPLYAPYRPPPPPPQMHPNVAALFAAVALGQQLGPNAPYLNHFNTNAANMNMNMNMNPMSPLRNGLQANGAQRTPAEQYLLQAQAELQGLCSYPTAHASYYQRPPPTRPVFGRRPPPHFVPDIPAQRIASLANPPRPLPTPPTPTTPQHKTDTDNNNASPYNDNESPSAFGFHARAATAPVYRRGSEDQHKQRTREASVQQLKTTTTTATWRIKNDFNTNEVMNSRTGKNLSMNTNRNTKTNMKTNQNMNPNSNLDAVATKSPPPVPAAASTRVFLGPRDILRLPGLKFA
jgi:hypothetical protein